MNDFGKIPKMEKAKPCKIYKEQTNNLFNINFKATPICEQCSTAIFLQQAAYYVKTSGE